MAANLKDIKAHMKGVSHIIIVGTMFRGDLFYSIVYKI